MFSLWDSDAQNIVLLSAKQTIIPSSFELGNLPKIDNNMGFNEIVNAELMTCKVCGSDATAVIYAVADVLSDLRHKTIFIGRNKAQ